MFSRIMLTAAAAASLALPAMADTRAVHRHVTHAPVHKAATAASPATPATPSAEAKRGAPEARRAVPDAKAGVTATAPSTALPSTMAPSTVAPSTVAPSATAPAAKAPAIAATPAVPGTVRAN